MAPLHFICKDFILLGLFPGEDLGYNAGWEFRKFSDYCELSSTSRSHHDVSNHKHTNVLEITVMGPCRP